MLASLSVSFVTTKDIIMRGFFLSLFGMVFPQGSDTLQSEYIEDGIEVANDSLCEESDTLDNEYVEDSIEASEYSFEDQDTPEDQDTRDNISSR